MQPQRHKEHEARNRQPDVLVFAKRSHSGSWCPCGSPPKITKRSHRSARSSEFQRSKESENAKRTHSMLEGRVTRVPICFGANGRNGPVARGDFTKRTHSIPRNRDAQTSSRQFTKRTHPVCAPNNPPAKSVKSAVKRKLPNE